MMICGRRALRIILCFFTVVPWMNGGGVGVAQFRAFSWELLDGWLSLRYRVMSFPPCLMDTVPSGYSWEEEEEDASPFG